MSLDSRTLAMSHSAVTSAVVLHVSLSDGPVGSRPMVKIYKRIVKKFPPSHIVRFLLYQHKIFPFDICYLIPFELLQLMLLPLHVLIDIVELYSLIVNCFDHLELWLVIS